MKEEAILKKLDRHKEEFQKQLDPLKADMQGIKFVLFGHKRGTTGLQEEFEYYKQDFNRFRMWLYIGYGAILGIASIIGAIWAIFRFLSNFIGK